MKILSLRFNNLNSLIGTWNVDFCDAAFESNSFFAITGPTGGGKTTLLDAICLALYAETPRLGRITSSSNDIMSQQKGECSAEVVFECAKGKYACTFEQHRARRIPKANLVTPKHILTDCASGKIIEDKLSKTKDAVERITGLNFDRFCRSVMLAQGEFAAFLNADESDRAEILEQITGTELYSEISKKVHEKKNNEAQSLETLKAEHGHIQLLTEEERLAHEQSKVTAQQEQSTLQRNLNEIERAIKYCQEVETLQNHLQGLQQEANGAALAQSEFAPKDTLLKAAMRAAKLEGKFAEIRAIRTQSEKYIRSLKEQTDIRATLEQNLQPSKKKLETATTLLSDTTVHLEQDQMAQKEVAPLDERIKLLRKEVKRQQDELSQLETRCQKAQATKKKTQIKFAAIEQKVTKTLSYQQSHGADAHIGVLLSGIGAKISHVQENRSRYTSLQAQHSKIVPQWEQHKKRKDNVGKAHTKAELLEKETTQNLETARQQKVVVLNNKQRREYEQELNHLQEKRVLTLRIATLEDDRKQLTAGTPCPLCGAKEHPFASGEIPQVTIVETQIQSVRKIIAQIDDADQAIHHAQQTKDDADNHLKQIVTERDKIGHDTALLQQENVRLDKEITLANEALQQQRTGLLELLAQAGVDQLPDGTEDAIYTSLKKRAWTWEKAQEVIANAESQKAPLLTGLKEVETTLQEIIDRITQVAARKTELNTELDTVKKRRIVLYGNKSPKVEEQKWQQEVHVAKLAHEQNRAEHQQLETDLQATSSLIESLQKQCSQYASDNETLTKDFLTACQTQQFTSEQAFVDAKRSPVEIDKLQQQANQIQQQLQSIEVRQKEKQQQLKHLLDTPVTTQSTASLEVTRQENQTAMQQQGETIGALKKALDDDSHSQLKAQKIGQRINAQQKTYLHWEQLHQLIGSSDGKKYRNFAQGITFEQMISYANRQLAQMSDRYLLLPVKDAPLWLNVMDNHQAGEIRTTKNLSGGESFIVSLALALGLSQMASQRIRIDSLFLDEGFGTLDEAALETALDTLGNLHQEGKLIGVISHIAALKERIPTQIRILPQAGGTSRLAGPGCTRE